MTISSKTREITQVAAHAIIEKIGTDLIAIDLSDQLVLSLFDCNRPELSAG
jgi:ribosome-associated protein